MSSPASELAYASGSQLSTEKPREFRCDVCNARCTRGTEGTEYGHQYGCPNRPTHFPRGGSGGATYQSEAEGSA